MLLAGLNLWLGCRGGRGRRRRCAAVAVAAAGVHDDASAFPGFNEAFAGVRAVELQNEIIHVGDLFQQIGGVGVHFFQERAAIHNLAARQIHHAGKGVDGVGQGGNTGGGHAASGGTGFGHGGAGEVADGGRFVEQVLLAELHDLGFGHVHLCEFFEVAGFLKMIRQRAGENVGGIFQGGFGLGFGIARAAARGIGQRGLGGDGGEIGLKLGKIGGEVGGRIARPDPDVIFAVGHVDTRANHVNLVCEANIHDFRVFRNCACPRN